MITGEPIPSINCRASYDWLVTLLAANGIVAGLPASPSTATWSACDAGPVVAGDMIDKWPQPVEVIDALRALEASAPQSGGLVVVLLGNHEAEFLADPSNKRASGTDGVNGELAAKGLDCGSSLGVGPHGAWLRARPLGARVRGWFYSHGGNTNGRSLAQLDGALSSATRFADPEIVGTDAILEARDWYADTRSPGERRGFRSRALRGAALSQQRGALTRTRHAARQLSGRVSGARPVLRSAANFAARSREPSLLVERGI